MEGDTEIEIKRGRGSRQRQDKLKERSLKLVKIKQARKEKMTNRTRVHELRRKWYKRLTMFQIELMLSYH